MLITVKIKAIIVMSAVAVFAITTAMITLIVVAVIALIYYYSKCSFIHQRIAILSMLAMST